MGDPARSWGNTKDWASTIGGGNHTPTLGSIASWGTGVGGRFGHLAYVEQVSGDNVYVRADNFPGSSSQNGYTDGLDRGEFSRPLLHPHDVAAGSPPPTGGGAGGWSTQSELSGSARRITLARNADGRLEVFYVGTDAAIWHRWQTSAGGGWSPEARLGGHAVDVAAQANGDGRLEVFYVGGANTVWHRWQTSPGGDWSGEGRMDGAAKAISVARNQDGRLEVFTVGMNDAVWHRWQTSAGAAWSGEGSRYERHRPILVQVS
jgi:surface antigen